MAYRFAPAGVLTCLTMKKHWLKILLLTPVILFALVYLAGSASAPFLGALVWNRGGYDMVLPGLILLSFCGLLLYVLAHRMVENK